MPNLIKILSKLSAQILELNFIFGQLKNAVVQIISDRNGELSSLRKDRVDKSYSSNDKRKQA
jgi:hypothetical protein